MPPRNMPRDWEPPYPAWSGEFAAEQAGVTVAYLAMQSRNGGDAAFHAQIAEARQQRDGPGHLERAAYVDSAGWHNDVYIAFWTDEQASTRWRTASAFADWWSKPERTAGETGFWCETFTVPMSHLETLFSSENPAGMAALARGFRGPVREHAYWGAARDRLPCSATDSLGEGGSLKARGNVEGKGRRVRITPPGNLCIIRSAQNWSRCAGEEREIYLKEVQPALEEGMAFLARNPVETGCISCRYMHEVGESDAPAARTFGLACFLTLGHLEAWARSHPTHIAIFRRFHGMVQRLEFNLALELWHEVVVLPPRAGSFEYVNCHAGTGLLPFFEPD